MRASHYLNLFLAAAVIVLAVKIVFFGKSTDSSSPQSAESIVLENIHTRTSVRAYQDKALEDAQVETLLRAAMAAPTGGNKQPWKFVVVKNRAVLDTITNSSRSFRMVSSAPLAIVVCGDLTNTFPAERQEYWVQDASAATQNLLLAAHSMGLGAVWCGIYPVPEHVALLKELLQLPEHIVPLNIIPIGYPGENPEPKDKWKPEHIHYDTWRN